MAFPVHRHYTTWGLSGSLAVPGGHAMVDEEEAGAIFVSENESVAIPPKNAGISDLACAGPCHRRPRPATDEPSSELIFASGR